MTREEKEFKILGRMIRKPPTSCTGTRLVRNHACWGGSGPPEPGQHESAEAQGKFIGSWTNQSEKREREAMHRLGMAKITECKRKGTGVLRVVLDPQSLAWGFWSKCPLLS